MTIKDAGPAAAIELRLSDTALVLLSHGAGRDGGMLLPAPETVRARGGALEKVLANLLRQGLVAEAAAAEVSQAWRTREDGQRIGLRITDTGLLAIGVEPRPVAAQTARAENNGPLAAEKPHSASEFSALQDPEPEPASASDEPTREETTAAPSRPASPNRSDTGSVMRPGSKQALLVEQVGSASGAALSDLVALLGWQPHTIRAALTGLRRKGFAVTRSRKDSGETVYRASRPEPAGEQGPAATA